MNVKILAALLTGVCFCAIVSNGQDIIFSRKVDNPPVIDGKLDDRCWAHAAKTSKFRVLASENPDMLGQMLKAPKKFTDNASIVYVCNDDKNLYVGYLNPAPQDVPISAKKYNQDSKFIWRGDCVELFLDPLRKKRFFQLGINALGSYTDISVNPAQGVKNWKWQSNAKIKTQKQKSGYTVEIAIPFSSMGNPKRTPGTVWGVNFTRQGKSCGGLSTWANVGKNFHSVDAFGLLIFGDSKRYLLRNLATLKNKLHKYRNVDEKKRIEFIDRQIADLNNEITATGSQMANFTQMSRRCRGIDDLIRSLAFKGKNYLFWQKDIWGTIEPNEKVPIDTRELTDLNIYSAQNAFISTGFVISNLSAKPLTGRLVFKKEKIPGTTLLKESKLEFYKAMYVEMSSGKMVPDALLKLPPMNIIEVPAHTSILLWIEIDTHNLRPGKYSRTITFLPSYSGFKQKAFKIKLKIAPVNLQAPRLKQWTYLTDPSDSSIPECVNILVRHGVTTIYAMLTREGMFPELDKNGNIVKFDTSVYEKKITNMLNAGVKKKDISFCFWLGMKNSGRSLYRNGKRQLQYGTAAWKKGFVNSLRAIRDYLFKQGFSYDDIALILIDEPRGDKNNPKSTTYKTFDAAKYVRKADPKLKLVANMVLDDKLDQNQLKDYIARFDIIEPYRPHIDITPSLIKQLQNSRKEIWTYSILPKSTYPTALRNMSWENIRDGFSSVTPFWAFDAFAGDGLNSYDFRPDRPDLSMDYGTCYFDKKSRAYIPSRRLKAWYQGNQDYRAVYILKKMIRQLMKKGGNVSSYKRQLNKIIKSTVNGTSQKMRSSREKIIRMIDKLKKIK